MQVIKPDLAPRILAIPISLTATGYIDAADFDRIVNLTAMVGPLPTPIKARVSSSRCCVLASERASSNVRFLDRLGAAGYGAQRCWPARHRATVGL